MKTETLLETIEKHIEETLEILDSRKQSKLVALLDELVAAGDETTLHSARKNLFAFCRELPYLYTLLDTGTEKRPVVFRGKPQPKPMNEQAKKIRLLANRIVDAIEKQDKPKSKNEK
jgi:hypothetical protein